ncbi:hypothetical protein Tco_1568753 [Tanacetum coccineum]
MLLNTVLGSLGIYFLSMFVMPVGVAKQLESMRSHFFWGRNSDQRKMAQVSWDSVMASYSHGGLNIGSLVQAPWSRLIASYISSYKSSGLVTLLFNKIHGTWCIPSVWEEFLLD